MTSPATPRALAPLSPVGVTPSMWVMTIAEDTRSVNPLAVYVFGSSLRKQPRARCESIPWPTLHAHKCSHTVTRIGTLDVLVRYFLAGSFLFLTLFLIPSPRQLFLLRQPGVTESQRIAASPRNNVEVAEENRGFSSMKSFASRGYVSVWQA